MIRTAAGRSSPRIFTSSRVSRSGLNGSRMPTLKVTEWNGDVVFLHEVVPGAADRSYGLQVARLAGLPEPVVARARTILEELERADRENPSTCRGSTTCRSSPRRRNARPRPRPPPPARDPPAGRRWPKSIPTN